MAGSPEMGCSLEAEWVGGRLTATRAQPRGLSRTGPTWTSLQIGACREKMARALAPGSSSPLPPPLPSSSERKRRMEASVANEQQFLMTSKGRTFWHVQTSLVGQSYAGFLAEDLTTCQHKAAFAPLFGSSLPMVREPGSPKLVVAGSGEQWQGQCRGAGQARGGRGWITAAVVQ